MNNLTQKNNTKKRTLNSYFLTLNLKNTLDNNINIIKK